jgi:membrane protease subunit HflC
MVKSPWGDEPGNPLRTFIPRPGKSGKWIAAGVAGVALLLIADAGFYRVPATDLAYVTRFGRVLDREGGPIGPGLHVKLPLADTVDLLRISTDTAAMQQMETYTRDTQKVILQVSVTYSIPPTAVYHLLYEVGKAGDVDIVRNFNAIVNDRVRTIIGRRDITEIAGVDREKVIGEIKSVVVDELGRLFGVTVLDVQISTFKFSAEYEAAVNNSTLARAAKLKAEQDKERAVIDAEATKVRASGEAEAAIQQARGQAESNLARAKAEAEATLLRGQSEAAATRARGEAEAEVTAAKIKAAGGIDGLVRQMQAQAALNWKGEVPSITSGANGASMPLIVPLPGGAQR